MTVIIKEIFNIISQTFSLSEDTKSLNRFIFMMQLKYLSYKVLNGVVYEVNDDDFLLSITSKDKPEAYDCVCKIRGYLLENYQYKMSVEDEFYLMIHLSKLGNENTYY